MITTEKTPPMRTPEWFDDIRFAFSLKSDGQMSFKRAKEDVVRTNRHKFLQANGLDIDSVVAGELVHGSEVKVVSSEHRGSGSGSADWVTGVDGLVTDDPNLLLLTTHADCAPILIYDSVHRVLGQAHAGWRSLRGGIVENLVENVRSFNGSSSSSLKAWIGPTVRPCCYPVGREVSRQFPAECRILVGEAECLDLARFILMEFARLEMDPTEIVDSGICTACNPAFSSFRRDGDSTVAMALIAGL